MSPVFPEANAPIFFGVRLISDVPSNETLLILQAVFSFVAVAALPDSSPERPALNVYFAPHVCASSMIGTRLVVIVRLPGFPEIRTIKKR